MMGKTRKQTGFTIVELLIVIAVIAILAAITVVAYSGIQARARDSQRQADVRMITKALELYYIDNGRYPAGSGSTVINGSWSTTADASWPNLAMVLKPYLSQLSADPISTAGTNVQTPVGYNYAYFSNSGGVYCGAAPYQMYILVYRFEALTQINDLNGTCVVTPLLYGGGAASNYRMSKL